MAKKNKLSKSKKSADPLYLEMSSQYQPVSSALRDPIWEKVISCLTANKRLNKLYSNDRKHLEELELKNRAQLHGHLYVIYQLIIRDKLKDLENLLSAMGEEKVQCLLLLVLRSLRYWVETEYSIFPEIKAQKMGIIVAHA